MTLSKKTSVGLALGAFLVTSGYLALKRYRTYREWKEDLDCIPWDVPDVSWKSFLKPTLNDLNSFGSVKSSPEDILVSKKVHIGGV